MAIHFAQVSLRHLILVEHAIRVVEGAYAVNAPVSCCVPPVHQAHSYIVAMCHPHTVYCTAFAALGRPLKPISLDAAAFGNDRARRVLGLHTG